MEDEVKFQAIFGFFRVEIVLFRAGFTRPSVAAVVIDNAAMNAFVHPLAVGLDL